MRRPSSRSTSGGLDISFQQAQWGGSGGADGLAFFLVDGATDLTQPGAGGGIDSWGNFGTFGTLPASTNCTENPGQPGSRGTGATTTERTPDRVVVR